MRILPWVLCATAFFLLGMAYDRHLVVSEQQELAEAALIFNGILE